MAATTPRKTAKKAAPRKARARTTEAKQNGNGHATTSTIPPEEFVPAAPPKLVHPYGNVPVHVYQPRDGSAPIVFPKVTTVPVTAKFMWKIYNLAEIFQSFEWMNLAGVPRDVQERVVDLPPLERQDFWAGWFADVTTPMDLSQENMSPPGESSS